MTKIIWLLLFAVLALLLISAAEAFAQTTALPTRLDLLVIPAAGDANTVAPVATTSVMVNATSLSCNQAPSTNPVPTNLVNPTAPWEVDDPFHAGRKCRVNSPALTGIPDGSYRAVAVFVADSCNPTGSAVVSPCPSPRSSVGLPPFTVVVPVLPPAAPSSLRITN